MQLITQDNITEQLQILGVQYSPTALILPPNMTFESWADLGKKLCRSQHIMNWWIADWAAFGETEWPGHKPEGESESGRTHWGALKRFAEINGWAEKTIYNAASVARGVETSRRRNTLTIGHHEAVCSLAPREQEKWLELAEKDHLTRGALRAVIRKANGTHDANKPDGVVMNWPQQRDVQSLVDWFKRQPVAEWNPEVREWWKNFLKPLVEIYEAL